MIWLRGLNLIANRTKKLRASSDTYLRKLRGGTFCRRYHFFRPQHPRIFGGRFDASSDSGLGATRPNLRPSPNKFSLVKQKGIEDQIWKHLEKYQL